MDMNMGMGMEAMSTCIRGSGTLRHKTRKMHKVDG